MTIEQVITFLAKETKLADWELAEQIWLNAAYYVGLCGDIIGEEAKKFDYDYENDTDTYNRQRVDSAEQACLVLMDIDQGKLNQPFQEQKPSLQYAI